MARVLVVDDGLEMCRVMAVLLGTLGHEPHYVLGGQAALDYLQEHVPDLILLDVMMTRIDGPQVLRAIRQRPQAQDVPVVMYSALNDPDIRRDMTDLGANDYW